MKIGKNKVVTLKYKMFDAQNNSLLDDDFQQSVYLHGNGGGIFEKIEEQLENKEIGFNLKIQLEPNDAFGEYNADLLALEDKSRFPADLAVGMVFEGIPGDDDDIEIHAPENEEEYIDENSDDDSENDFYTVTDIVGDKVILDANHPLAGMAIRFDIVVIDIRDASEEELENGYIGDEYDNMISVANNVSFDEENDSSNNSKEKPTLH